MYRILIKILIVELILALFHKFCEHWNFPKKNTPCKKSKIQFPEKCQHDIQDPFHWIFTTKQTELEELIITENSYNL